MAANRYRIETAQDACARKPLTTDARFRPQLIAPSRRGFFYPERTTRFS